MARLSGPARAFGLTLQCFAGDDTLYSLPQMVEIILTKKKPDGTKNVTRSLRPMLHRITANTMNMVTASSQERIVERMGKDFTIRNKSNKERFPSFIQNQAKITQWAYAKNFPDIDTEIAVTPQPFESNRKGTPLISNVLSGGLPGMFIRMMNIKNPEGAKEITMIQFDKNKQDNEIDEKDKKRRLKKGKVLWMLYRKGHQGLKQKASLNFIELAQKTIDRVREKHFIDLVEHLGDDRRLTSQFKYYDKATGGK